MKVLGIFVGLFLVGGLPALGELKIYRHPDPVMAPRDRIDREQGRRFHAWQFYITGFRPFQRVEYSYIESERREIMSDRCGGLRIRLGSENLNDHLNLTLPPQINLPSGVQPFQLVQGIIIPATIPIGLIPRCINGQWEVPPRSSGVRTRGGEIFLFNGVGNSRVSGTVVLPNTRYLVQQSITRRRTRSANACGVVFFSPMFIAEVAIGERVFNSLPAPHKRLLCVKGRLFEAIAEAVPRQPSPQPGIDTTPLEPIGTQPLIPPPPPIDTTLPPPDPIAGYTFVESAQLFVPESMNGIPIGYLTHGDRNENVLLYFRGDRPLSSTAALWWNRPTPPTEWGWDYDPESNNVITLVLNGQLVTETVNVLDRGGTPIPLNVYVSVPWGWF